MHWLNRELLDDLPAGAQCFLKSLGFLRGKGVVKINEFFNELELFQQGALLMAFDLLSRYRIRKSFHSNCSNNLMS